VPVGNLDGIRGLDRCHRRRQFGSPGHARALDQHRKHLLTLLGRGLDFEAHEVGRIVEPATAAGSVASHDGPMSTMKASHSVTDRRRRSANNVPGANESMSRNTCSTPSADTSQS
jgi:hypothetical protein